MSIDRKKPVSRSESSLVDRNLIRKSFGESYHSLPIPYLLSLPFESYESFLQSKVKSEDRKSSGLHGILKSMFPISDYGETRTLEYVDYEIGEPEYSEHEAIYRGINYAAPVRARFRLVNWVIDSKIKKKKVGEIKEQSISICMVPIMTKEASFIINGVHKVVLAQLVKAPGVFVLPSKDNDGTVTYSARIIPHRGSWIDIELDSRGCAHIKIDTRKRILLTTWLMAMPAAGYENKDNSHDVPGMSYEEILTRFYPKILLKRTATAWEYDFNPDMTNYGTLSHDLIDINSKVVMKAQSKITKQIAHNLYNQGLRRCILSDSELVNKYVAVDVIDHRGVVVIEAGTIITSIMMEFLRKRDDLYLEEFGILFIGMGGTYICNTLVKDRNKAREDALYEIYKTLTVGAVGYRPELAYNLFKTRFFDTALYDLSDIGRMKLNDKLGLNAKSNALTKEDILGTINLWHRVYDGYEVPDDIDNLGNRKVKAVGELLENHIAAESKSCGRAIKDRLAAESSDSIKPSTVIHAGFLQQMVQSFFAAHKSVQMASQENLLSHITQKRRISSVPAGGTKDRINLDAREVHHTHCNYLCNVECPDGLKIGLINSKAIMAVVDDYGIMKTCFKTVKAGRVTGDIVYLSAAESSKYVISYAEVPLDDDNRIIPEHVFCRKNNEGLYVHRGDVGLVDVAAYQMLSVTSNCIPFIGNDDSVRAVMGSNMQRQALPILGRRAPLIGTGMEGYLIKNLDMLSAKRDGKVVSVDTNSIVIKPHGLSVDLDIYNMKKMERTGQKTCRQEIPRVKVGDLVKAGDILYDNESTHNGELALGTNVLVAFSMHHGYVYEDAVVVSERLIAESIFTSISIEEFECVVRHTAKSTSEILTRDVPGAHDDSLKNLDESGIVKVGAYIKSGDILVGKAVPRPETNMMPAQKLLHFIFKRRPCDMQDGSLYVPNGISGVVTDVRIINRVGTPKDERSEIIERSLSTKYEKEYTRLLSILESILYEQIEHLLLGEFVSHEASSVSMPGGFSGKVVAIDKPWLHSIPISQWKDIVVQDDEVNQKIRKLIEEFSAKARSLKMDCINKIKRTHHASDLPVDVVKIVKVSIAVKRNLREGDKISNRHGNKGIISKIARVEDMPFIIRSKEENESAKSLELLECGRYVDMVWSALSISSRMNPGQTWELSFGLAAHEVGKMLYNMYLESLKDDGVDKHEKLITAIEHVYGKDRADKIRDFSEDQFARFMLGILEIDGVPIAIPPFTKIGSEDLNKLSKSAGIEFIGKVAMRDGVTGEKLDNPVTVGMMYVLKLDHMVDNKLAARAHGLYTMVNADPAPGTGAQRFGEMEVWAAIAQGGAWTIQEIFTTKSDDIKGRRKLYSSPLQSEKIPRSVPESFKILQADLKALCVSLMMVKKVGEEVITINPNDNLDEVGPIDGLMAKFRTDKDVLQESYGEVTEAETLNYRTHKPEKGGLFCARIFGPISDFECMCKKYIGIAHQGRICDKCGVEICSSSVRRERFGHIDLRMPIIHIWTLKVQPSILADVMEISAREIEKVAYFEKWMVIDPANSPFQKYQIISDLEKIRAEKIYGPQFVAQIGAEAVREVLKNIRLESELERISYVLKNTNLDSVKRRSLIRKLNYCRAWLKDGHTDFSGLVLSVIPVSPPGLRPIVQIDNKFATSDITELYRRLIARANRRPKLKEAGAPEKVQMNECWLIQCAVDALFDNISSSRPVTGANKRPLQSLTESIRGKTGRMRHMLGKRADFSGRSTISINPKLSVFECELPLDMVFTLFAPRVVSRLYSSGRCSSFSEAAREVAMRTDQAMTVLKEEAEGKPVFLNRAPSLHRYNVLSFIARITKSKTIRIPATPCRGFNADFDGDQMAVHIPCSGKSSMEASLLFMAANHVRSVANGKPMLDFTKDIILGIHYATIDHIKKREFFNKVFVSISEIETAIMTEVIDIHTRIKFLVNSKVVTITPGRAILYDLTSRVCDLDISLFDRPFNSREAKLLMQMVCDNCDRVDVARFVDMLTRFGFSYATSSGISYGLEDLIVPQAKNELIAKAFESMIAFEEMYFDGFITAEEKQNKTIRLWSETIDKIKKEIIKSMEEDQIATGKINSVKQMLDSGARGSLDQLCQITGIKGMAINAKGEVKGVMMSNFYQGLPSGEYAESIHGARKGMIDTACKTANAGYFTRRLVELAQSVVVSSLDCGTENFVTLKRGALTMEEFADKLFGRVVAKDILDYDGKLILSRNDVIDRKVAGDLKYTDIVEIYVRSVVVCKSTRGCCAMCYGYDLSSNAIVDVGEAVGIIAAQSISEPCTQLTLKTFQLGGVAQIVGQSVLRAEIDGLISFDETKVLVDREGRVVVSDFELKISLMDNKGRLRSVYRLHHGAIVFIDNNTKVEKDQKIAEFDPYNKLVLSRYAGRIEFIDLVDGISYKEVVDEVTGAAARVVLDRSKDKRYSDIKPSLLIIDSKTNSPILDELGREVVIEVNSGAVINVRDREEVLPGDILVKVPRATAKSHDIVSGFSKISDEFEVRKPKNAALLSRTDGIIQILSGKRNNIQINIIGNNAIHKEQLQDQEQEILNTDLQIEQEEIDLYNDKDNANISSFDDLEIFGGEGDIINDPDLDNHDADSILSHDQSTYIVPRGRHVMVNNGDRVQKGDVLVDGELYVQDVLDIHGLDVALAHFIDNVQNVYKAHGIDIADKHIEVIFSKMIQYSIVDPGGTLLFVGDVVSKSAIDLANREALAGELQIATGKPVMMSITRSSFVTEYIDAAFFQEAPKVLMNCVMTLPDVAAYSGSLRAHMITGSLPNVGTGTVVNKIMQQLSEPIAV